MPREAFAIRFSDARFESLPDFLQQVAEHRQAVNEVCGPIPLWFRGHKDVDWKLETTLQRRGMWADREQLLLDRFRLNAVGYLEPHRLAPTEWDWMFLMRHHRAPSRLLDWTESPLIALYFAVELDPSHWDEPEDETDGHVWVLLPTVLNSRASLVSESGGGPPIVPMFDSAIDSRLVNYRTDMIARSMDTPLPPVAGHGLRTFPRLEAQQGNFTIHHADPKPLDDWHDGSHLWRYTCPWDKKATLRAELRAAGINRLALFRDLDAVAWVAEEALRD